MRGFQIWSHNSNRKRFNPLLAKQLKILGFFWFFKIQAQLSLLSRAILCSTRPTLGIWFRVDSYFPHESWAKTSTKLVFNGCFWFMVHDKKYGLHLALFHERCLYRYVIYTEQVGSPATCLGTWQFALGSKNVGTKIIENSLFCTVVVKQLLQAKRFFLSRNSSN